MPDDRETFTDVMTYNLTAGFEGSIPGTDWTWEAFVNHGESHTFARQTGIYSLERTQTRVPARPASASGFNGAQGNHGTRAASALRPARCTSGLNFFSVPTGGFSKDCLEADHGGPEEPFEDPPDDRGSQLAGRPVRPARRRRPRSRSAPAIARSTTSSSTIR